jgi:hypothetical protein
VDLFNGFRGRVLFEVKKVTAGFTRTPRVGDPSF